MFGLANESDDDVDATLLPMFNFNAVNADAVDACNWTDGDSIRLTLIGLDEQLALALVDDFGVE